MSAMYSPIFREIIAPGPINHPTLSYVQEISSRVALTSLTVF
jgi:hypothetical protein